MENEKEPATRGEQRVNPLQHVPRLNEIVRRHEQEAEAAWRGSMVSHFQRQLVRAQDMTALHDTVSAHAVAFQGLAPCGRTVELRGLILADSSAATLLILSDLTLCLAVPTEDGKVRLLGSDAEWIEWAGGLIPLKALLEIMNEKETAGYCFTIELQALVVERTNEGTAATPNPEVPDPKTVN